MSTHSDVLAALHRNRDPFDEFIPSSLDKQGWHCTHRYLTELIQQQRPRIVVEVGVWKGASAITMAREMQRLGLDSVVIAVDTWLGDWQLWTHWRWAKSMAYQHGFPMVYHTFMSNVVDEGLKTYIVPMPLDSVNAFHLVSHQIGTVDAVHIDASHDYESVRGDFRRWHMALRTGGVFIADDYHEDGSEWPEVRLAMQQHLRSGIATRDFEACDAKCRYVKG